MILLEDECGCIVVIVLVTFCILYVNVDCCYLSFPYNFTRYRKVKGEHLEHLRLESRVGGTE